MTTWRGRAAVVVGALAVAHAAAAAPRALTLSDALRLARAQAPAVRAAQARVAAAEGQRVAAQPWLANNPVLRVGGGPRLGDRVQADLDVSVQQVFELGGQRAARVASARAGVQAAQAQAREAQRRAVQAAAVAFLQARHAEAQRQVAADAQALAARVAQVAERRVRAGDVGALEGELAALTQARARADHQAAQAACAQRLGALRRGLGLAPDAEIEVVGPLLNRRRYSLAALLARAPERADLQALAAQAEQADAQAQLGEAEAWPDLGLGVAYGREEGDDLVLGRLSLTLPVFQRGQGQVAVARGQARAARTAQAAAQAAAQADVRAAHAAYTQLAQAAADFAEAALPRVARSEALAQTSYEAGALGLADLLAIRRELLGARRAQLDLELRAALAGAALEAAAGGSP